MRKDDDMPIWLKLVYFVGIAIIGVFMSVCDSIL